MVDRQYRHVTRKTASSWRSWELGHVGSLASFSVLRSDVGYYAESDHGAVIWKRRRRATHVTPTAGAG